MFVVGAICVVIGWAWNSVLSDQQGAVDQFVCAFSPVDWRCSFWRCVTG